MGGGKLQGMCRSMVPCDVIEGVVELIHLIWDEAQGNRGFKRDRKYGTHSGPLQYPT